MGVRGILMDENDFVVAMEIINADIAKLDFLTVMERGIGKKTPFSGFPKQHRGGQGVKVAQVTDKTGKVVAAQAISPESQNLVLTSEKGQVVKLPLARLPRLSRATSGVILMRMDKSDKIAAATCIG